MPSVGLLIIYSNHCNTRQQKKKEKKIFFSAGAGSQQRSGCSKQPEQLFGFKPGAKKMAARGNQPNRAACWSVASAHSQPSKPQP
tara:strand:+ start:2796 stop:3050 length:255 start_codon:yes stop_codon:yes gene_type:complete